MVRKHSVLLEKTVVKVLQKLMVHFLCLNEGTEIPSLCVTEQGLRVGSSSCSSINWQWGWNSRKNIFPCLYSKKKPWGHFFCLLSLNIFVFYT